MTVTSVTRPWRRELPAERVSHRQHSTFTTSHRPGMAGRFCWTCRLLIAEWCCCSAPTRRGRLCLARSMNGLETCSEHSGASRHRRAS